MSTSDFTLPYDWGIGVKDSALSSDREDTPCTSVSSGVDTASVTYTWFGTHFSDNMPCKMLVFSVFGHCIPWFFGMMQKWLQEYLGVTFHVLEACVRFSFSWVT